MGPVIAVHEHELLESADPVQYKREVANALKKLNIPGLLTAYHLEGIKGERKQKYSVLWVFKNQDALVKNFGTEESPKLPKDWLSYENDVLVKFLDRDPDKITYTDYQTLETFDFLHAHTDHQ